MTKRIAKKIATAAAIVTPEIFVPRSLLLPYQDKYSYDDSRFKIGLMARQTGKDFSSTEEIVHTIKRAEHDGLRSDWMIAAPSERQSLDTFDKVKEWSEVYDVALDGIEEEREGKSGETLLRSKTMTFPKGSTVCAVPGKPGTVRGKSVNVLMTEFGFFEDPDETWRAILPSITNPLRGGPKKIRVISTPNGQGNKLHSLWAKNYNRSAAAIKKDSDDIVPAHIRERIEAAIASAPKRNAGLTREESQMQWSCHRVTIYDAVAQGLPVNLFELYAGMDDPIGWAQEYECDFLDSAAVLLPYELIARCEALEATTTVPFEFWDSSERKPLFMGWDFARKRDLSVPWVVERVGDVLFSREMIEMRGMSTPAQIERATPMIRKCERVCVDYTGPGVGVGDYLVKEFQEWKPEQHQFGKIELCTFTNKLKVDIFSKLRMIFENAKIRVPVNREIREDLHSVYRAATPSGNVTYSAPHSADGHADRCTSLALAVRAAGDGESAIPDVWI